MKYYIFQDKNILADTVTHALPGECVWNMLKSSSLLSGAFSESPYDYSAAQITGTSCTVEGYSFIPLRQYFAENSAEDGALAGRAKGLTGWRITYQFCPSCGAPLADDRGIMARTCTKCGKQLFPRIEPAVIVLITRGDKMLLARHKAHNSAMFSCIAGFIELGESAEQAVVREVREETGLEIKDLRYFGSQGWPFPDQLMLGYRAEYAGGEIRVQESELYEAEWFSPSALPAVPNPGSMGYALISSVLHDK
jgi:NAD+ diphosphatase